MKTLVKIAIFVAVLFFNLDVFSQKFGHIDSKTMQGELQNKYQSYVAEKANLTDLIRQTKEQELQDLQQRIQTFQGTAQQELQKKEMELLKPIIQKAQDAIKEVGKENGFTYIYDIGTGAIVYYSEESIDILPMVKKKLGIN
ncbi:MAG: hypothetical protein B6I24_00270 [Bacteroidetes bacterium 4572_128]|nr:MAG: hypothetical protein B6I24_00270 [Bacteroidetes bacterium 4572_128]